MIISIDSNTLLPLSIIAVPQRNKTGQKQITYVCATMLQPWNIFSQPKHNICTLHSRPPSLLKDTCLHSQSILLWGKNISSHFLLLSTHPHPHVVGRGGSNCPVYTPSTLSLGAASLCSEWKAAVEEQAGVKAPPRADSYPADFNRRSPPTLSFQPPKVTKAQGHKI